jgi:hypothetical protein
MVTAGLWPSCPGAVITPADIQLAQVHIQMLAWSENAWRILKVITGYYSKD